LSQLPADQFERMRDLYHFGYAGRGAQRFDFRATPAAADRADDGALRAGNDVCLEAAFFDAFDDVVDFVGGCVG
jgi:hypothetical protein